MLEIEIRTMRPEERGAFLSLMEAAFADEDPAAFALYLDEDPHLGPEDTLVALEGERLVSSVQIFTRTIRLRGAVVRLGGIGSVATHPDCEGRGFATRLLRRAIDEMRDRGMALSLLFTGRISFYERLDWKPIDHPVLAVRRGEDTEGSGGRPFAPGDLAQVKRVYEAHSAALECTTVRDDLYWERQLRFAGNPDERFRVVERNGRIVAYAREIEFMTIARIMELGCEDDARGDLAELLVSMAPPDAPLFVPDVDAPLGRELERVAASCDRIAFPGQMWRVLDRSTLERLAGERGGDDAALLASLVSGPRCAYWPSDRF